jgi:leucyl-tRNA synthetase
MDRLSFNTAIAALIELNSELVALDAVPRPIAEALVLCLSPMAPHLSEELWRILGHPQSLAYAPWPSYDPALLIEDDVEYPVQVNGKLRCRITVPATADDPAIEKAALANEKTQTAIAGKKIKKIIIARGRMVNIVIKD